MSISVREPKIEKVPQKVSQSRLSFWKVLLALPFAALSVLVALVFSEFLLGMCELADDDYLKPDPIFGMTHLPGKSVTFRMEGFAREKINSAGFRDVEHTLAKPPGVKRILFLGDSKAEALQVPIKDTFASRIAEGLSSKGQKFESINLAMSSYSNVQEYLEYLLHGRKYHPDVTVLVYNYMDSFENHMPALKDPGPRPFIYLDKSGHLKLTFELLDLWLQAPATRLMIGTENLRRTSHLYQTLLAEDLILRSNNKIYSRLFDRVYPLFNDAFLNLVDSFPPPEFGGYKSDRSQLLKETEMLDASLPVDRDPLWAELPPDTTRSNPTGHAAIYRVTTEQTRLYFLATARLVSMLNLACRQDGSKLVVVTLPVPDGFMLYQKEISLLQKLAAREGFQVIDANAEFPNLKVMQKNPYYFSMHFTPLGHRKMAEIILRNMRL